MGLKAQQYLIWIGLVGAFGYFCALWLLMGVIPPIAPTLNAKTVVEFYAEHNTRCRIGGVVAMAAAGFWLAYGAVISAQMVRHESGFPIWSVLQAMASTFGAIIFAIPVLFWYVAAYTVTRNPEITATFNELAYLAFLTPIAAFTLQLLPLIVVCLASNRDGAYTAFPRWLAYLTVFMISAGDLPVLAVLFKTGPFAWNGIVGWWLPLAGFTVWVPAITVLLLRAIRHQAATENHAESRVLAA
jgi:hypothetical protein